MGFIYSQLELFLSVCVCHKTSVTHLILLQQPDSIPVLQFDFQGKWNRVLGTGSSVRSFRASILASRHHDKSCLVQEILLHAPVTECWRYILKWTTVVGFERLFLPIRSVFSPRIVHMLVTKVHSNVIGLYYSDSKHNGSTTQILSLHE